MRPKFGEVRRLIDSSRFWEALQSHSPMGEPERRGRIGNPSDPWIRVETYLYKTNSSLPEIMDFEL